MNSWHDLNPRTATAPKYVEGSDQYVVAVAFRPRLTSTVSLSHFLFSLSPLPPSCHSGCAVSLLCVVLSEQGDAV